MMKKCIAVLLCLMVLSGTALAELGWSEMSQYKKGLGVDYNQFFQIYSVLWEGTTQGTSRLSGKTDLGGGFREYVISMNNADDLYLLVKNDELYACRVPFGGSSSGSVDDAYSHGEIMGNVLGCAVISWDMIRSGELRQSFLQEITKKVAELQQAVSGWGNLGMYEIGSKSVSGDGYYLTMSARLSYFTYEIEMIFAKNKVTY